MAPELIAGFLGSLSALLVIGWKIVQMLRVQDAKADRSVASDQTQSTISDGQTAEFARLQLLGMQIAPLSQRVAVCEAALAGLSVLLGMLKFCPECTARNADLINTMQQTVQPFRDRRQTDHSHPAPPNDHAIQ